jgi:hypothetical protein
MVSRGWGGLGGSQVAVGGGGEEEGGGMGSLNGSQVS